MNRLQQETSPYLRQHAHNPVDWYAWKPEAFERARAEDKPILVSIGYSTCHWCHVMERESFEHDDVAAYMNEHFINIKVDREERPDVDAIYMEACQLMTGGGGWPLNCFLTPEAKPFFAGTYYPPRPAYGRPSWLQLLQHLAGIWENQRSVALDQAEKLLGHIRGSDRHLIDLPESGQDTPAPKLPAVPTTAAGFGRDLLESMYYRLRDRFDRVEGGFGDAPKFPGTMVIQYLLRYHHFTGSAEALEQAQLSLDKMIRGGIYDQLGGGFARYATDRAWLIPHFEKMLYDNALLVVALAEAYKLTGQELYRETIEETLDFVQREMTHPDGGFYSAQDADSEGVEGKFYVWSKAEVDLAIGDEAELFSAFYDVTEHGNWEEQNILWRPATFEAAAASHNLPVETLKARLKTSREKLFQLRAERIPPGLDDKVLLGWNAMMISAYAAAFSALGHETYRDAARRSAAFLTAQLGNGDAGFLHGWKDGQAQYDAFLDDYALVIAAWIDLYEITFERDYLTQAEKYASHVLSYFDDPDTGLFFFTGTGQSDVILRKKDLYDNATPSGNSTMAHNLQRLGLMLDRPEWRERSATMLLRLRPTIEQYPSAFARWAMALMNEVHPPHEIAVVGAHAVETALAVDRHFLPNRVLAASAEPDERLPLLAGKTGADPALIYVCRDYACQRPVQTLEEFRALIGLPEKTQQKNQP